jgi:hypothetical protein
MSQRVDTSSPPVPLFFVVMRMSRALTSVWRALAWMTMFLTVSSACGATLTEKPMDPHPPLYTWLRGGASLYLARVADNVSAPAQPGQEQVTVRLAIARVLHGPEWRAAPVFHVTWSDKIVNRLEISRSCMGSRRPYREAIDPAGHARWSTIE